MQLEETDFDLLKRKEENQQDDSYSSLASPPSPTRKKTQKVHETAMTQLRQDEDERLRSGGDDSEDDLLPPDPFYYEEVVQAVATKEEVDTQKVMDLRDSFKVSKEDEAIDEYTWYDGSPGSNEAYDKEEETSSQVVEDEATYAEEFTNYTYDRSISF